MAIELESTIRCKVVGCNARADNVSVCEQHWIEFTYYYGRNYPDAYKGKQPPTIAMFEGWLEEKRKELLGC